MRLLYMLYISRKSRHNLRIRRLLEYYQDLWRDWGLLFLTSGL